jgi:hypothetical protein
MPYNSYERSQLAGDQYEADFATMFGAEIESLATWLNRAPEGADIEAHYEQICESHDFDGIGTNWEHTRECFESWSPRLRAARILREAQS